MKIHFGHGIAVFYGLFVLFFIGLVVASTKRPPILEQKDYYALDLGYQNRLDAKHNSAALSEKIMLKKSDNEQDLMLIFPTALGANISGKVTFKKPETAADDLVLDISADFEKRDAAYFLPLKGLKPGRWRVEIAFEALGKAYFEERVFVVTSPPSPLSGGEGETR